MHGRSQLGLRDVAGVSGEGGRAGVNDGVSNATHSSSSGGAATPTHKPPSPAASHAPVSRLRSPSAGLRNKPAAELGSCQPKEKKWSANNKVEVVEMQVAAKATEKVARNASVQVPVSF